MDQIDVTDLLPQVVPTLVIHCREPQPPSRGGGCTGIPAHFVALEGRNHLILDPIPAGAGSLARSSFSAAVNSSAAQPFRMRSEQIFRSAWKPTCAFVVHAPAEFSIATPSHRRPAVHQFARATFSLAKRVRYSAEHAGMARRYCEERDPRSRSSQHAWIDAAPCSAYSFAPTLAASGCEARQMAGRTSSG